MRKAFLAFVAAVFTVGALASFDAEARRLGGAKSSGMQRQNTTAPPANAPGNAPGAPAQSAAPAAGTAAAAAPAAAAATAKRSWMGPVAGLAAGLGIAALASHFGFGEALANMLTMALIAMAVLFVIGFILRKRAQSAAGGMAPAYGGAAGGNPMQRPTLRQSSSLIGSGLAGGAGAVGGVATPSSSLPADFDAPAFERNAKQQFMALQSANDAGDFDRLRDCLTPEMLEIAREDVIARNGAPQTTEVFGLSAQVLDVTTEAGRYIVSVRFTGSVRTEAGAVPDALDEVWHLTKPREGMGGWLVAGIQQLETGTA